MKKGIWISLIALLAAAAGTIVAITAFMKKRGRKLRDELDFDDIYLEDDSDMMDDDYDTDDLALTGEADESIESDVDTDINEAWQESEEDEKN